MFVDCILYAKPVRSLQGTSVFAAPVTLVVLPGMAILSSEGQSAANSGCGEKDLA